MANQRRSLLRLGATLLLIAAAMGIGAAMPLPNPSKWMVAHMTSIMLGTLIMVQGLAWNDLRLSAAQRTWLVRLTHLQVWSGLALGIATALMNIPGPATAPGVSTSGLQGPILGALLALIVPATIAAWVLLWVGLRGDEPV